MSSKTEYRPAPARPNLSLAVLAGLYTVWAIAFVWRGSFVAIDGNRYSSLFDDALISMRYAWNLSHGAGLVWNPGEYVEGYSNLLMTLFMSIWTFFLTKREAVLAVKLAGIPFIVGSAYFAVRISRCIRLGSGEAARPLLELMVYAGTLLYYPLSYWTLMGMETGMLTALLLVSLWQAFRLGRASSIKDSVLLGLSLGLLYLTRADSLVPRCLS